jgi:hypothetical protein
MDHDAVTLRALAIRTRAEAQNAADAETRDLLSEAAETYERMADLIGAADA